MIPLVCFCIAAPRPLVQLLNLLQRIRLLLSAAFFYIGLGAGVTPVLSHHHAPTSPSATPSRIKAKLRVVEFRSPQATENGRLAAGEEEPVCAFCLEALQTGDHVRELGNCGHAFHKPCMDRWVDLGRVTCPMCRSDLLPKDESKGALESLLGYLWVRRHHNFGPLRPVTRINVFRFD